MKSSTMYSLVDAARVVTEAREIVLKGLKAFANDESMLDDLENDLQGAGLKPTKDYVLDQKKGTLTLKNKGAMKNRKVDNIKRIYRLKEELETEKKNSENLEEGVSGSASDIINAAISQHEKLDKYFDDVMEDVKSSMQKALSLNIAEYMEAHVKMEKDLRIVLEYMADNPQHIEKVIKKHLKLDVIDMAKIVAAIGPDIAEDITDEIVRDAKFAKFASDAKDLGDKAKDWVKGLFS